MTSARAGLFSAVLVSILMAASLGAQPTTTILLDEVDCWPDQDNGVAYATIDPLLSGTTPRLYFRWDRHGAFYYVEMDPEGSAGRYWGVPPKPEERNESIEYFVTVVDPEGRELSRSATHISPVENGCDVELTERQRGYAQNLFVGETDPDQRREEVLGFLCDGVVARIDSDGIERPDDFCRACIIPIWWKSKQFLIPAGTVAGACILLCDEDDGPASPILP